MNRPKLRFPGFTDDWEQRKLSELCEIITVGIANSATHAYTDEGIVMFRNQNIKENYLDDSDLIYIKDDFEKKYKNKRLKKNDLLVARTGYPGTACVVPEKYEGSQTFTTLIARLNEGINPYYACQYMNSECGKKYFLATQIGGGQKNSGAGILEEFPMMLPPTVEEQDRIADYFTNFDNLFTLHQRKCDNLKELKKAMLSKMFPKEGEKRPEVRFPGFNDDWEQRKLGDVVNVCSGRDYKHLEEGDIPVYGTGGYMLSVSEALSEEDDAIGIGRKGTIDKPYILRAPFWTVDTLFYCIPNEGYDLNFSYDVFQTINWKMMDESTGVPSLSKAAINDVSVLFPSNIEQNKIGAYFNNLDNLITLHQRKCDYWKEMKKAMLQKMFV